MGGRGADGVRDVAETVGQSVGGCGVDLVRTSERGNGSCASDSVSYEASS